MVQEVKSGERPVVLYLYIRVPVQAPVVAHDKYKTGLFCWSTNYRSRSLRVPELVPRQFVRCGSMSLLAALPILSQCFVIYPIHRTLLLFVFVLAVVCPLPLLLPSDSHTHSLSTIRSIPKDLPPLVFNRSHLPHRALRLKIV